MSNLADFKDNLSVNCFRALNSNEKHTNTNYFSLLYKLDFFHVLDADFSGIFMWSKSWGEKSENKIDKSMVLKDNVHNCHYKSDILEKHKFSFEDTFCIFGHELNSPDTPVLEAAFFANRSNYFYSFLRQFVYNKTQPVEFNRLQTG